MCAKKLKILTFSFFSEYVNFTSISSTPSISLLFHLITDEFYSLQYESSHFKFELWQLRTPSASYLYLSLERHVSSGGLLECHGVGGRFSPSARLCPCLYLLRWLLTPTDGWPHKNGSDPQLCSSPCCHLLVFPLVTTVRPLQVPWIALET